MKNYMIHYIENGRENWDVIENANDEKEAVEMLHDAEPVVPLGALDILSVEEYAPAAEAEAAEKEEPIYIDENWPESNEKEGVHYTIEYMTESSSNIHANLAYTAEELRGYVSQIKNSGYRIVNAYRYENDKRREFIPETTKEKTERENREHCKRIAEELEAYAEGTVYRCPECGEIIEWDNEQYNDEEAEYTCQCCGETFDESDLEAISVYDFIADVYDIEYRIGSDMEYRSVKIMVACGGPNIYIDTARRMVQLHWWTDYAEYPISNDAAEELDNVMEELYQCH